MLLLVLSPCYSQILDQADMSLIESTLERIDLTVEDTKFLKDWSDATYLKNELIVKSINDPFFFIEYSDRLDRKSNDLQGVVIEARTFLANGEYPKIEEEQFEKNLTLKRTISTEELATILEQYIMFKRGLIDKMFSPFSEAEIVLLSSFTSNMFSSNEQIDIEIEGVELEELIMRLDWEIFYTPFVLEAGSYSENTLVIHSIIDFLKENQERIVWEDQRYVSSCEAGDIIIGSIHNDIYELSNCAVLIEPSGSDIYHFIHSNQQNFLFLDFAGEDTYRSENSLFSAKLGFSIGADLSGSDCYLGGDETFSAKLGYQTFVDESGDDIYRGEMFSLGASIFGSSILIDNSGNDNYTNGEYGEGFASAWAFAMLLDNEGDDNYFSGNIEYHKPLAPNDFRSMGQGMGYGLRPDIGGGVGILKDSSGNDRYSGGVYAQAVGYWYGLGILIDGSGNDFYNAVYYPQGSGIHLAGGLLHDKDGDDSYYSKHGPGQGAGHDFGVGVLIDSAGDDHYSVEGGNGLGLTNSFGLFLDKQGADRYENGVNSNYGYGKGARASASIGLFIDGGGTDYYPKSTMQDSSCWVQGMYGVALDTLYYIQKEEAVTKTKMLPADIDSLGLIKDIFAIASEWEVGNAVNRVRRAREILLTREVESAEYIFLNKLNSRDTKEYRAIKEFAKASLTLQDKLVLGLESSDSLTHKNCISLIASTKRDDLTSEIIKFLKQKQYITTTLSALASFKKDEYLPYITKYLNSPNEKIRFSATKALVTINSEQSLLLLKDMLTDDSFLIKSMAKIKLDSLKDKE